MRKLKFVESEMTFLREVTEARLLKPGICIQES